MNIRKALWLGAVLLTAILCRETARAAEGDYILKDRQVYRVDGGKETLLEDEEAQWAGTDGTDDGLWAWVLVDPDMTEEMQGSEGGIYFFRGADAKPAGFLPMKDSGSCVVELSPSGEKMLISRGGEAKRELGFYLVDTANKRFVKKAAFTSAGRFFWIDPHRFVFSSVDERKGPRIKNWEYRGNEGWRCSVVLYDTIEGTRTVLKQATDTKNYIVTVCDEENGTLKIWEHFVKNVKDWNDEKKVKDRAFSIPIPAAG